MYFVIHGGVDKRLRTISAKYLTSLPFDGHAIGGSLGRSLSDIVNVVQFTTPLIPKEYPVHLLGIGDIPTISSCIPLGIDTFDSCYPARLARHGNLLMGNGDILVIGKKSISNQSIPIDTSCNCYTCINYTRNYLHHLYKVNEASYYSLATIHNIYTMSKIMQKFRDMILNNEI